jgi:hypothetical protein
MHESDLIAPDVQRLIHLFSALEGVRFPDIDAALLHDAFASVKERHLEVLQAEAQLLAARSALDDEQEALLKKAHRLHAYLKVFAEVDEGLQLKLEGMVLPRLRRPATRSQAPAGVPQSAGGVSSSPAEGDGSTSPGPAPKRRGRPRKVVPTDVGLFSEPVAPAP